MFELIQWGTDTSGFYFNCIKGTSLILALVFLKIRLNCIGLPSVSKSCDLVSAEPYNLEKDLNSTLFASTDLIILCVS